MPKSAVAQLRVRAGAGSVSGCSARCQSIAGGCMKAIIPPLHCLITCIFKMMVPLTVLLETSIYCHLDP